MPDEQKVSIKAVSDDEWNELFAQFDDVNYRQLAAYSAAAAARMGASSENMAIRKDGRLLGLCNVRTRKLPLLPWGIAYVNGAPLVHHRIDGGDCRDKLTSCLLALSDEYVRRRGYVLRMVGLARGDSLPDDASQVFDSIGFLPSDAKGKYRTILLDIDRDLVDIRRGLDQKWRNVLNKAERQGLEIVRGTGVELFDKYAGLHRELVQRKKLDVDLGPEFFRTLQEKLGDSDRFVVHLALQAGEVVAGHIGAFHGDTAVYLLGAANENGLKCNASYLLQWRVIEYAKERACRWYDLGGIDPAANPDVFRFKARMGGLDTSAPGPYEAGSAVSKTVVRYLEWLYRRIKR